MGRPDQGMMPSCALFKALRTSADYQSQQNGGRVLINDKQADMLIGDCARKDQPPGSYSWKFIETSVRNGVLHDKEDFLIGGVPAASRPAGSSQPQKKTRTAFTEKDDQILAAFVAAKVKEGFAAKGNQLYQALASKVCGPEIHLIVDRVPHC